MFLHPPSRRHIIPPFRARAALARFSYREVSMLATRAARLVRTSRAPAFVGRAASTCGGRTAIVGAARAVRPFSLASPAPLPLSSAVRSLSTGSKSAGVVEVTDDAEYSQALASKGLCVVYFTASWCAACAPPPACTSAATISSPPLSAPPPSPLPPSTPPPSPPTPDSTTTRAAPTPAAPLCAPLTERPPSPLASAGVDLARRSSRSTSSSQRTSPRPPSSRWMSTSAQRSPRVPRCAPCQPSTS